MPSKVLHNQGGEFENDLFKTLNPPAPLPRPYPLPLPWSAEVTWYHISNLGHVEDAVRVITSPTNV